MSEIAVVRQRIELRDCTPQGIEDAKAVFWELYEAEPTHIRLTRRHADRLCDALRTNGTSLSRVVLARTGLRLTIGQPEELLRVEEVVDAKVLSLHLVPHTEPGLRSAADGFLGLHGVFPNVLVLGSSRRHVSLHEIRRFFPGMTIITVNEQPRFEYYAGYSQVEAQQPVQLTNSVVVPGRQQVRSWRHDAFPSEREFQQEHQNEPVLEQTSRGQVFVHVGPPQTPAPQPERTNVPKIVSRRQSVNLGGVRTSGLTDLLQLFDVAAGVSPTHLRMTSRHAAEWQAYLNRDWVLVQEFLRSNYAVEASIGTPEELYVETQTDNPYVLEFAQQCVSQTVLRIRITDFSRTYGCLPNRLILNRAVSRHTSDRKVRELFPSLTVIRTDEPSRLEYCAATQVGAESQVQTGQFVPPLFVPAEDQMENIFVWTAAPRRTTPRAVRECIISRLNSTGDRPCLIRVLPGRFEEFQAAFMDIPVQQHEEESIRVYYSRPEPEPITGRAHVSPTVALANADWANASWVASRQWPQPSFPPSEDQMELVYEWPGGSATVSGALGAIRHQHDRVSQMPCLIRVPDTRFIEFRTAFVGTNIRVQGHDPHYVRVYYLRDQVVTEKQVVPDLDGMIATLEQHGYRVSRCQSARVIKTGHRVSIRGES